MQLSTEHQCVSLSGESEVMSLQSRTGHSHTHSMPRGSRQVFLHLYGATQSQEISSKGVFLNPCVCDSHGTLTHSNTSSRFENKNPAPFQKSKVWPPKCLGTCLLAGVWWAGLLTSCLGLFSPSRIFSTVQPDPGMDGGGAEAQESVWHNRNNWGSVCEASRQEWERNRKQECCYGVHYWKRRLHACDLHSLFSVGYITERDWVWACICIRLSWSGIEEEEFDLWPHCDRIEDLRTL